MTEWEHYLLDYAKRLQTTCAHQISKGDVTDDSTTADLQQAGAALLDTAAAFGWCHGLCILRDGKHVLSTRLISYSILPSLIPRQCFELAVLLSPIFTRLVANMTLQPQWLYNSLESVGELDPEFTQKLLNIAQRSYGLKESQRRIEEDIRLILIRSDYMIDCTGQNKQGTLQQVELNTISLSFSSLAEPLTQLHRITTRMLLPPFDANLQANRIPENPCAERICNALRTAHDLYCKRHCTATSFLSTSSKILGVTLLTVVRELEKNQIDQRLLEFRLQERGVPVKRIVSFDGSPGLHVRQRNSEGALVPSIHRVPQKGRLFVADHAQRGFWEVSVVYYRTGYDPEDYSGRAWIIREVLERSDAVKCPNVLTHLAGIKKIQSLWCDETQLEPVLPSKEHRQLITQTFADQADPADFKSPKVFTLINEAMSKPEDFILKPQREGGLHNIHGDQIRSILQRIMTPDEEQDATSAEGRSFILMRKIRPEEQFSATLRISDDTSIVSNTTATVIQCISELGTFGIHVADGATEILHLHGGHLLRTKDARNAEGGVATGAAFLDSPLLVD